MARPDHFAGERAEPRERDRDVHRRRPVRSGRARRRSRSGCGSAAIRSPDAARRVAAIVRRREDDREDATAAFIAAAAPVAIAMS